MTSFPLDNNPAFSCKDSYRYFLPPVALFNTDNVSPSASNLRYLFLYVMVAAGICCASNSWLYLIAYTAIHHDSWYQHRHLYLLYTFLRNLASSLLSLIYISKFLILPKDRSRNRHRVKIHVLIWFLLEIVVFNGIGIYIASQEWSRNTDSVNYSKEKHDKIFTIFTPKLNSNVCDWIDCGFTDMFSVYTKIMFFTIVPAITISAVYLYEYCSRRRYPSQQNTPHSTQLEMGLLSPLETKTKHDSNTATESTRTVNKCHLFGVHVAFFLSYSWTVMQYYILMHLEGAKVKKYYAFISILLIFLFAASKFVLKRICRRLDWYRIHYTYYRHDAGDNDMEIGTLRPLSLEFCFEFLLSVQYWAVQREYIVYDVPAVGLYVLVLSVHLCSEVSSSVIRSSRRYFEISSTLLDRYKDSFGFVGRRIIDTFATDCDLEQWRLRFLIDMVLRFIASTSIGLVQAVYLLIWSPEIYQAYHDFTVQQADYYVANIYNVVSTLLEFVYFSTVIVLNYKSGALFIGNFQKIWTRMEYKYLVFIFCVMTVCCWH